MKIGVITFSDFNTNYGSMLQAYALKEYLEGLGHDVTEIRYREYNKDLPSQKKLQQRAIIELKTLYKKVIRIIKHKDLEDSINNFSIFRSKAFKYTNLMTSSAELREGAADYDAYIAGSDQIWNIACLGGLRTPYFLDFAPEKAIKIAYAASMGGYVFNSEESGLVSEYLDRFDDISLREKSDIPSIQSLTTKKVEHVCDPVFLLSKEEWESKIEKSPIEGAYGVCYFVRRSLMGNRIVRFLKETYHMPIYNLSDNQIYISGTNPRFISVDPMMFLSILSGAKFTVGTSFHLAAFSIIFNIPVFSIGLASNSSRIGDLLKRVNASDRYISSVESIRLIKQLTADTIYDYKSLDELIKQSKAFLCRNLQ